MNNLVGQQVGKGGLLQPVGDLASKEGVNRAERGGKDESGGYGGPGSSVANPIASNAKSGGEAVAGGAQNAGNTVAGGAQSAGNSVWGGAKSAGGYVGGMFGGKKEEQK